MAKTEITVTPIARVYGELVVKGLKTYDQVPERIRGQVGQYLLDSGRDNTSYQNGKVKNV